MGRGDGGDSGWGGIVGQALAPLVEEWTCGLPPKRREGEESVEPRSGCGRGENAITSSPEPVTMLGTSTSCHWTCLSEGGCPARGKCWQAVPPCLLLRGYSGCTHYLPEGGCPAPTAAGRSPCHRPDQEVHLKAEGRGRDIVWEAAAAHGKTGDGSH